MFSTTELIAEFDSAFQAYVNLRLPRTSLLHEAMAYSLLNGGKRLRPRLVIEAAALVSLPKEIALKCAFAIEIAHGFSLVHDDLPCLDNDDQRRGMPTTHRKFSEPQALLAGDALLNFAHETFLECLPGTAPTSFFRASKLFLKAIGSGGMLLGQSNELEVDDTSLDELLKIQSLKTGKLFQASILCPLLLSGLTSERSLYVECEKYAESFGFAFQIADDLEDEAQDQLQNSKNILSHLGRTSAVGLAIQKLRSSKISEHFSATKLLISKLQ